MKINTNLYGFIYKRSNGKFTATPYMGDLGSAKHIKKTMDMSKVLLRRKSKDMKLVKLTLETVE